MKGLLADLLIKLGLDSKEFEKGVDNAKGKTNAFAAGLKNIGGMIAGAFAVSSIIAFGKHIFQLANESIRIENELGAAIRANGKDVETNMAAYKAFAEEMQNLTTVDDEATLSALRLAETLQSRAPIEATKNAIALSKAIGVDLNTAVKMAVMAQSDMYTMLGRYVPALRQAGTEAERTAEYNKLLASGQQMLTDELNTAQGKIIQNQNAWENVKETWGSLISQSKILSFILKKINDDLAISNSSLKWYEKYWYRITMQHGKGAEKARELGKAEADAAMAGIKGQTEFNNLLGEITLNAEEYNKKVKKQKELKDEAFKAWEKENEAIAKQRDLLESIDETKSKLLAGITSKAVNQEDLTPGLGAAPLIGLNEEKEDESYYKLLENHKRTLEEWQNFKMQMSQMAVDFGIEVVDELGAAFGELIKTGDFPKDFGKNILSIVGGFLSQLGKMLITYGIAQTAFWESFKMGPAGAFMAIAAGAALVAIGGMIKGFASEPTKGSASSGGGYSVSSQPYSRAQYATAGTNGMNGKIEVFGMLKGDSIFLSNQRTGYKRNVIG